MKKTIAFTLAEVLITLTILGVVAAIMVPSLQKQNIKRTQVTKMAKAYAALENAAQNIATTTNCLGRDLKCTGLTEISDSTELSFKFAELAKFRVAKKYNSNWVRIRNMVCEKAVKCSGNEYTDPFNVFYTSPDSIGYNINTTNVHLSCLKGNDKCQDDMQKGLLILVVTEGNKAKFGDLESLKTGRNVFYFVMYDNFQVEPVVFGHGGSVFPLSKVKNAQQWVSWSSINENCDPDISTSNGKTCAARIIRDGWKMKY